MNDLPENSNNNGAADIETLDYLRGVKSSTCLLLPTTPSPTPIDFKHPLSEEMAEQPFLTINDDNNLANSHISEMERRAPSRVSEAQWNILMDFLESNPSLARARGYNNSARGRAEAFRLWQEVATLLNAEGSGTTKSPKEWSVYVSNYKSKLKKIVADINADASATGGGPPRASNMTEFETRFLALLGAGFGQTAPRVMVLPFANEEPSTSAREAESQMVLVEEVDDDTQCQEEEVADDNIQHSIDIDDPLQILPDPPAQPATPRASLPEANEPLLPRRRRQRGQRNASAGDSSSSADSNSVVQDPVSAQLINNISMLDYQTLSKNVDLIIGPAEDGKLNGNLNVNNRKLPNFVNWNWGIIRKVLLWIVISGLVACLSAIIAMLVTIPKECNPNLPWYQGKVFYEVFPASFKDSNNDGTGDLKGLIKKLDYIQSLGASAIRLNYIFKADNYPVQYYNISSLLEVERSIGVLKDFEDLVLMVHSRNMSIILDIPVSSMANSFTFSNSTLEMLLSSKPLADFDTTSVALAFWAHKQKVDGFYLKNLENFISDVNFGKTLQFWKTVIGNDRIFIASEHAYDLAKGESLNVLLSRIDLIDVHLDMDERISSLKERIDKVVTGSLWAKPHYPWVHWNIGNIGSERISSKHVNNTLALTALELILPGTVSIFYGDEIGLGGLPSDGIEVDFHEHKDIHNLVPMKFANNDNENGIILPWNSESTLSPKYHFLEVIKMLTDVRLNTPTIYLRAIYKEGNILKNMAIRETEEELVVIERWYPRRNTCVFVGNLGSKSITTDLSSMFYGGTVVAGTNMSLVGQVIYFDQVTFPPNSAIILKLEK